MTAPAAPEVKVKQFGGKLRLAWREVQGATDYNVYLGDSASTLGVDDSITDAEGQSNGWFVWWSGIVSGVVFIKVTALNAQAEESTGTVRSVWLTSDRDVVPDVPTVPLVFFRANR